MKLQIYKTDLISLQVMVATSTESLNKFMALQPNTLIILLPLQRTPLNFVAAIMLCRTVTF